MDKGEERLQVKKENVVKRSKKEVKQGKDEESGKGCKWRRELRQERGNLRKEQSRCNESEIFPIFLQ